MFIIQVRSIKEGCVYWEDYHAENNIDNANIELKKYEETFGENEVRLVEEVKHNWRSLKKEVENE